MHEPTWTTKLPSVMDVDVWMASLNQPPEVFTACLQTLSQVEMDRYRGYGDREAADAFVIRRGTIRHLLAEKLGLLPRDVKLAAGKYGKPYAKRGHIDFSVSSSRELAAFALTGSGMVGIDVEWIDPDYDVVELIGDKLPKIERSFASRGAVGFFELWTAQEACVTALGHGLAMETSNVAILSPGIARIPGYPAIEMAGLELPANYSGTVARIIRPAEPGEYPGWLL